MAVQAEGQGYFWARISHTGQIDIVQIIPGGIVCRFADEQTLGVSQIEIIERIPAYRDSGKTG